MLSPRTHPGKNEIIRHIDSNIGVYALLLFLKQIIGLCGRMVAGRHHSEAGKIVGLLSRQSGEIGALVDGLT